MGDVRMLLVLAFALPLGLAVVTIAGQAWRGQRRAFAARRWPSTGGVVAWSGVGERQVRQRRSTSIGSYRMATRYAPRVVYAYTVDGVQYRGERLRMGDVIVTSDYDEAERGAARYPAGSAVTVYYNPSDPADSTLDPRTGWGTRILWMVALLLLVIITVLVAVFLGSPPIR